MEFKNIEVMNFKNAFRGMRNPKDSWALSDSIFGLGNWDDEASCIGDVAELYALKEVEGNYDAITDELWNKYTDWLYNNATLRVEGHYKDFAIIGPKDMKLAKQLIRGGSEHRKFLRQIFVSIDITAPLYIWKELDTYKVGTTANSTSTMHTITNSPITFDKFEVGDFLNVLYLKDFQRAELKYPIDEDFVQMCLIPYLEYLRQSYLGALEVGETETAQSIWKELIRWLPESWLQTRTWTCNYEILRNIYHQRKNHKLTEWHEFCDVIETLPYANELIIN